MPSLAWAIAIMPTSTAYGWTPLGNNLFRNDQSGQVVDGYHPIYQQALTHGAVQGDPPPPQITAAPHEPSYGPASPGFTGGDFAGQSDGVAQGWSAIGNNLFRHLQTGQVVDGNHPIYQQALNPNWQPPASWSSLPPPPNTLGGGVPSLASAPDPMMAPAGSRTAAPQPPPNTLGGSVAPRGGWSRQGNWPGMA